MKLKIQITSWFNGSVLFEYEAEDNTIKKTITEANLTGADLTGANLTGADLTGADLTEANLRGADLRGADLREADLTGANLREANLTGANLREANLTGADLTGANLTPIKNDFFVVLLHGIKEIKYLKENVINGNINGSTYDGDCSCLSGTLHRGAIIQDGPIEEIRKNCIMSVRDSGRPIERFFLGIDKGDTPENNQASKLVLEWIEEFEKLIS